ncbi:MAG: hypothetical protein ABIS86_19190 [Streptosporangiaceae bacterium]
MGAEVCPDCWHEDCTGTCETPADRAARIHSENHAKTVAALLNARGSA